MKRLLLLLPVCFILQGNAQTVITTAVKPAVGDSFYYAFDTITTGISITAPGGNQNWDLSFLNSPLQRTEVYRPKDQGANGNSFPTADAVVTQGLTEYYYKFNASNIQLLGTGTRGGGPLPGVGGANVYPNPVVVQRYPQQFGDLLEYETVSSVYIPSNILPDSILNLLPLKPDSFRINFKTKFTKTVDAWGGLKLPAKTWDVQREKRVTNSQTTVDAKVTKPFPLGWIDVTALAAGIFAGFFGDLNTTSYAFVSNETKGLIALINLDTTGNPISIQYKPDDKIQVKTTEAGTATAIELLRNPVSDQLVLRLPDGIPAGSILHIYDAHGHLILESRILDAGSSVLDLNVKSLPSGLYSLQIVQKNLQNRFRSVFLKI